MQAARPLSRIEARLKFLFILKLDVERLPRRSLAAKRVGH
jgi:hypothetical protein